MSLIVARKAEGQMSIVSDTKLTYPDQEIKRSKDSPSEGMIKSVIINPDICISFAGEIENAGKALSQILPEDSIDKIIEILKQHHIHSSYKTEFLLCYAKPELTIYKFKNNEYGTVASSWIGDQVAFNRFQEHMNGVKKKEKLAKTKKNNNLPVSNSPSVIIESMNLSFEAASPSYLSRMSSAMDDVIEDGNINSVGGFKINVRYNDKFYYNFYIKSYRGEFAMTGHGSHVIGHGGAGEGAYSLNFFGGSADYKSLAFHIKQANLGVVYHREDNGLLWPKLFKMDEVDFSDLVKERYQLQASLLTQDRGHKFTTDGRKAFEEKQFEKALNLFEKAIQNLQGKKKAEVLFFKGVALLNLRNVSGAKETFQAAITIDPPIQYRINLLFKNGQQSKR